MPLKKKQYTPIYFTKMNDFYNNFIFINKYFKEERVEYYSYYTGVYKNFSIMLSFCKGYTTICLTNRTKTEQRLFRVNPLHCIEMIINNKIKERYHE